MKVRIFKLKKAVGFYKMMYIHICIFLISGTCLAKASPEQTGITQQSTIIVTGTVTDDKGETLPGVTIMQKGTTKGTATDIDGNYSISVSGNNAVLVFSYLGYVSQERTINNNRTIDVKLTEDTRQLDEVVVVGYGSQRKESLTGAISNIKSEEILTTTNSSLAQSLQGKVAGLQIRQYNGEPGDFSTMINIRGFGTPLYVIDGVARDGDSEFQRLNPQDIESISVLKDASAAIYGLRAANGVVIVTTKKGKRGKPSFQYDGVVGWQKPTDVPRMTTASEFAQMWNQSSAVTPWGSGPKYTKEELQKYIDGAPGYENVDWYDTVMKDAAFQQQHTLSVSGGGDQTTYFMSLGYNEDNGLLKSGDLGYKKYTFRSNLSVDLTKRLKAEVLLSGRYDRKDAPGQDFMWIFKGTRITLPTVQPYANNNPEYLSNVSPYWENPLAVADKDISGYRENVNKSFQSMATLTYDFPFLEGLQLKGSASYDSNDYLNKTLSKSYDLYSYSSDTDFYTKTRWNSRALIENNFNDRNRLTFQAQLSYNKKFANAHNVGGTLVYEQQDYWERTARLRRYYTAFTGAEIDLAGTKDQETGGMEYEYAHKSIIGRFNYDFKSKYLLEFAFREDGSYRYNPDNQWGFFPVVSAGWRISEEDFVKKNLPFLSNLKLRGSYGIVGEDAGVPFQYYSGFALSGAGGYEFVDGTYTSGVGAPSVTNPNLTWFKSKTLDIGVDVGLWNKLNVEFDVYQRDRNGLLGYRNTSLPNTFGGSLPEENLNSDRVRGLDFAITYNDRIGDFHYGVKANFNYARTMNRYVERGSFTNSMDKWRNGSAYRWNDIAWGYDLYGQFQNTEEIRFAPIQYNDQGNTRELPGDYRYVDANEDGVIDGNDMMPLFYGGQPKYYYGLTLSAEWKGFDLYALFQGSAQYTVRFYEVYADVFAFGGNVPAYFYDRWHLADPYDPDSEWIAGKWPAARQGSDVGAMYIESSVWRRDASYVRLKSLELGYTIKPRFLTAAGIERCRIYGNVYNVFTIADSFVKPFDPEKIEGAYSAGYNYPLMRSFNLGVSIQF